MTRPQSTREFEQQYAERSGVTVEWLYAHGRRGGFCDCGDKTCEGFQMRHDAYSATDDGSSSPSSEVSQ